MLMTLSSITRRNGRFLAWRPASADPSFSKKIEKKEWNILAVPSPCRACTSCAQTKNYPIPLFFTWGKTTSVKQAFYIKKSFKHKKMYTCSKCDWWSEAELCGHLPIGILEDSEAPLERPGSSWSGIKVIFLPPISALNVALASKATKSLDQIKFVI